MVVRDNYVQCLSACERLAKPECYSYSWILLARSTCTYVPNYVHVFYCTQQGYLHDASMGVNSLWHP